MSAADGTPPPAAGAHATTTGATAAWATLQRAFPWALLVVGLVLSALVPPMQSPDENDHLKRAYALATGQWFATAPPGAQSGYRVDTGLLRYIGENCHQQAGCERWVSELRRTRNAALGWDGTEVRSPAPGTAYYFPLIYAPQAVGLAIGRAAGAGVDASYRLARTVTLATAMLLLFIALRITPGNALLLCLLCVPMLLFQFVSPTQDGLAAALGVLAAGLYLRGMDAARPFRTAHWAGLFATTLLLATGRVYLAPLLLLPAAVAWRRRDRRAGIAAAVAVVAAIAWVAFAMATAVDTRLQLPMSATEAALHYAARPVELLRVLAATVSDAQRMGWYADTFVGVLGWLDTWFAPGFYRAAWVLLAVAAALSFPVGDWRAQAATRGILLLVAAGSALLVFLAMLVTWTPAPAAFVQGVQGRYFMVPALLLAYGLGAGGASGRRAAPAVALVVLAMLWWPAATAHRLLERYHTAPAAAAGAAPAWRTRPSIALAAGESIVLRMRPKASRPDDPLVALEVMFGTYRRRNEGTAQLELQRADGESAQPLRVDLSTLQDNAYRRFDLVPGRYVAARLAGVAGGGVSTWEAHHDDGRILTCLVFHYASGDVERTPGCPAPTAGPAPRARDDATASPEPAR